MKLTRMRLNNNQKNYFNSCVRWALGYLFFKNISLNLKISIYLFIVCVPVCTCVYLCVHVWVHNGHSMCTKVREQLSEIAFSLHLVNLDDQTHTDKFVSKCLYLLSLLIIHGSFFFALSFLGAVSKF